MFWSAIAGCCSGSAVGSPGVVETIIPVFEKPASKDRRYRNSMKASIMMTASKVYCIRLKNDVIARSVSMIH